MGSDGQAALVDRDAEAERVQRGPGNSVRPEPRTTHFGGDGVGRRTLRRRIQWAELKHDREKEEVL